MSKTFFDNAPDEDGCQLCLSQELTEAEAVAIVNDEVDYGLSTHEGAFDDAWINCDRASADHIKGQLYNFGWTENV